MTGQPEAWRARFRASMTAEPESACPPPETLWRAVRGELSGQDLESLATHLRSCGACGDAMAVSAELVAQSEPRRITWRPARIGGGAAGIAALAAGLLLFLNHRASTPREGAERDLLVSRGDVPGAVIRPLSNEEQPAAGARLQWTPVAGAVRYRVQVSTEDLRPVHDRTLTETSLALPPGVTDLGTNAATREKPSAGVLLWQVEALLPDGRTVTSSTFRLRLAATSPAAPR